MNTDEILLAIDTEITKLQARIVATQKKRWALSKARPMKKYLVIALLTMTFSAGGLLAQTSPSDALEKACGSKDTKLDTVVNAPSVDASAPPPGKARIIFVEDFRGDRPGHKCFGCKDVSIALAADGVWIAQDKGFSHSTALIEPGVHHLCARTRKGNNDTPSMLSLMAKAGETYYLVAIPQYEFDYYVERFTLSDFDEGQYLEGISKTVVTTAH